MYGSDSIFNIITITINKSRSLRQMLLPPIVWDNFQFTQRSVLLISKLSDQYYCLEFKKKENVGNKLIL